MEAVWQIVALGLLGAVLAALLKKHTPELALLLAGAGVVKNAIGVFGLLGVLAACLGPFVRLGVQYLLYKLTAFLAGMTAAPELAKLIDALGGVFGLMLGMTGSCALLLLISISSAILVVTP